MFQLLYFSESLVKQARSILLGKKYIVDNLYNIHMIIGKLLNAVE